MPFSSANDPLHWCHCAEEARAMADNLTDQGARETLLRVAEAYDQMAKRAEQQVLWKRPVLVS